MSEKLEVGPIYDTKQLPNWRHVMTDPFHAGTLTSPNVMTLFHIIHTLNLRKGTM